MKGLAQELEKPVEWKLQDTNQNRGAVATGSPVLRNSLVNSDPVATAPRF
jgi:hypothetical protein